MFDLFTKQLCKYTYHISNNNKTENKMSVERRRKQTKLLHFNKFSSDISSKFTM